MSRTPPPEELPEVNEWLSGEQVVERLLQDPVLRRVASTCVLPAVRCGDQWRFRKADLDHWIARQRRLQEDMNHPHTSSDES